MKYLILFIFLATNVLAQYQEATISRTTSTNSVFPRQFPSMTIRKMNENEYWIFDSLGTNTIFHRQFPTYIVRKENYGQGHPNQKWGVYRTTSTNSVYPRQFPDRYISGLEPQKEPTDMSRIDVRATANTYTSPKQESQNITSSYTYSRSLRADGKRAYSAESPE